MRLSMILFHNARRTPRAGPLSKESVNQALAQRLQDPAIQWHKRTVAWYAGVMREVEVATGTALWYRSGVPPVAIRWVLIRDPEGKFSSQALLCTDQNADPA